MRPAALVLCTRWSIEAPLGDRVDGAGYKDRTLCPNVGILTTRPTRSLPATFGRTRLDASHEYTQISPTHTAAKSTINPALVTRWEDRSRKRFMTCTKLKSMVSTTPHSYFRCHKTRLWEWGWGCEHGTPIQLHGPNNYHSRWELYIDACIMI